MLGLEKRYGLGGEDFACQKESMAFKAGLQSLEQCWWYSKEETGQGT